MPDLTPAQWVLAAVAAACLGISKAGFAGMSLIHVVVFAMLFGARTSTGIVLPMLIVGDICGAGAFRQHARWDYIRRMLPPACIGVMLGASVMRQLSDTVFKPIIGAIILTLTILQFVRMQRPDWLGDVPHSPVFAWTMGLVAGATTMLANAAGPIITIYCLSVGLPKYEMVGTGAWLFFILNTFKVPFSIALGLIQGPTLFLNLILAPIVVAGVLFGRWLVRLVPQQIFDRLILAFAALAAVRLIAG
jgi:uncharacterized membrane protein YfcA